MALPETTTCENCGQAAFVGKACSNCRHVNIRRSDEPDEVEAEARPAATPLSIGPVVLAFLGGLAVGALVTGSGGSGHSVADLRAMDDPRKHPCFQVAAESEQNQTDRIYDLVASVCRRYDRSGETELNEACDALLE